MKPTFAHKFILLDTKRRWSKHLARSDLKSEREEELAVNHGGF
jgi:hypothetical protein